MKYSPSLFRFYNKYEIYCLRPKFQMIHEQSGAWVNGSCIGLHIIAIINMYYHYHTVIIEMIHGHSVAGSHAMVCIF